MDPVFIVLAIALAAIVLFVSEAVPPDLVALMVLVSLAVTRVLTPEEALSGFASSATLTILAMFVLSDAVFRTGTVTILVNRMHRLGAGAEAKLIIGIAIIVGPISAFVNNTAAVAILLPVIMALAAERKRAPSRLLIPLSYAGQLGGVLTLIGTSTNILVSDIASSSGHRALTMFEFTPAGLVIFGVGALYIVFIAPRILPHRGRQEEEFAPPFRAHVVVPPESTAIGLLASSKDARLRIGGDIVAVRRQGHAFAPTEVELQEGDVVEVEGTPHTLLHAEGGGRFMPLGDRRFQDGLTVEEGYTVVEVVVAPGSSFVGSERGLGRMGELDAFVLGLHRKERFVPAFLSPDIEAGDTLLVMARKDRLGEVRDHQGLILAQEVPRTEFRRHRIPHVLVIFLGVVTVAALGILPIVVTALAGAALTVVVGALTMREFYRAIHWDVVLLLAGLIPLGTAFVKTGGADLLGGFIATHAASLPPWALLLGAYVLTGILTEFLSNNATVVLMIPIVISAAIGLGIDPTPFILAVAYAASTSFMTPIGYQTNTMIYGPGGYRFSDFFKVGGPLNLILAVVTTVTLAWLYGLM